MELSWLIVLKIGASLAGVLAGISMFSELSWPMKIKIAATLLTGIILIGSWALLGTSVKPFSIISVPTFGGAVVLVGLAVLAGFIGYFVSWPNGREIGVLAAPAGLTIWAVRSGNMSDLLRLAPTLAQRQVLFASLKWEPIFWLLVVAAGFGGVLIGEYLVTHRSSLIPRSSLLVSSIFAVIASVVIAQFCIGIFAQGVKIPDHRLGSVTSQPAIGQIVFAVLISFGIAAFIVKKFLNVSYIWPIIASALTTGFAIITLLRENTLQQLAERNPPVFFPSSVLSIMPLQMVAFGTLGSIAGYWLAVRVNFRQEHP